LLTTLRTLQRNLLLIVLPALAAAAATYALTDDARTYTASAVITLNPNSPDGASLLTDAPPSGSVDAETYVESQLPVFTGPDVLGAAAEELGVPAAELGGVVSASPLTAGNVQVSATASDANRALTMANAVARSYLGVRAESNAERYRATARSMSDQLSQLAQRIRNLPRDRDNVSAVARRSALESQYADLLTSRDEVAAVAAVQRGNGEIVNPAAGITESGSRWRTVGLAAVLGLLLGLGFVFVREEVLDRIRSRDDLEEVLGDTPVVGEVPALRRLSMRRPVPAQKRRTDAMLATWLRYGMAVDDDARCLLVTSPGAREGKTSVAVSLAAACAHARQRVVYVSSDLWHPNGAALLGAPTRERGLADWLATDAQGRHGWDPVDILVDSSVPGLMVMPPGSPGAVGAALASRDALRQLVSRLRENFDIVVLDSPPMLTVPYSLVLSDVSDGVLLVAAAGRTSRKSLRRALESVRVVNGDVGVVLNRSRDLTEYPMGAANVERELSLDG
jgi:Mrp family chromosome partitioning ATPase